MLGWLRASRNSARAGAGAGAGAAAGAACGAGRAALARACAAHRPRGLATEAAAAAAASTDARAAAAAAAAGAFVPPPLPEHKFDPRVIAGVDMGKYYSPAASTGAAALKLRGLGSVSPFAAEKPKASNPLLNPTALAEPTMPAAFPVWTPKSVRTGVLGQKIGMTAVWDGWGNRLPITVIRLDDCQVTQVKDMLSKRGTVGMQVGAGLKKFKHTPKSLIVHCLKAGAMPKKKIVEFPVTLDAVLPLGTTISARHFVPGQTLDIAGTTKGKGFQGAMYRWGFSGQPATHGVSLTHRSIGSVGSNQSPGRVLKGKKMAGRMGNERRTAENLRLHKVDVKRNLLYVQGAVPGNVLGWLEIRDSRKQKWDAKAPPPFPTYFPKAGVAEPDEIVAPTAGVDPNAELAGL